MAKQLNVNLAFTADTTQAKRQLQDLQTQLSNIVNSNTSRSPVSMGITKNLQEATKAAASLKAHLEQATNVDTGKLDLGLLNKSFQSANVNLDYYRQQLQQFGPVGEKAFTTLANSILKAEIPLKQSNGLLTQFATTLKNTARWQISSSILHAFMGTIQTAHHYAQDLNESLNNIRIVTGQSVDQMAKFAVEANKAAQALSTTTTEYTNASLIYYQQGLSDQEVKERTDVTVKMANVARESAEDISQQMTAIWNNFAEAGDNLEYYSDAIVALGAATASSSAEIAEGLEKFASVTDVIGLSYEYATSALATITAKTRQSASTVGNALKTIFSRMESLKLGKTLEDDTDLNKYTQALQVIGVSVKDNNGELRKMDDILDDVGAKWQTLARDQQMALATTVAGVRQYTQFVSLMDNWDFFQENVDIAKGSEGTLQEQADIYAESWEAARDRVKAAAESMYKDLFDDKFFIAFNNGLANLLKGISAGIQGIGGFKGVIIMLGSAILNLFNKDIAQSLDNFAYNLQDKQALMMRMRDEAVQSMSAMAKDNNMGSVGYEGLAQVQAAYIQNAEKMSDFEKLTAQYLMEQYEIRVQNLAKQEQETQKAAEIAESEKLRVLAYAISQGADSTQLETITTAFRDFETVAAQVPDISDKISQAFEIIRNSAKDPEVALEQLRELFKDTTADAKLFGDDFANALTTIKTSGNFTEVKTSITAIDDALTRADKAGGVYATTMEGIKNAINQVKDATTENSNVQQEFESRTEAATNAIADSANKQYEHAQASRQAAQESDRLSSSMDNIKEKAMTTGTMMATVARGVSTTFMALRTVVINVKDLFADDDVPLAEKLFKFISSMVMILPMLISSYTALSAAKLTVNKGTLTETILNSGLITSLFGVKASEDAATAGAITFEAAIAPLLIITLAFTAALSALVLVVMGLKFAFEEIRRASPEGQLELATKASEELATALEEAETKANDLRDAFDNYNSIVDKLNDCVLGTEEWNKALEEVNNVVLDILDKYPELASVQGLITRENGQLTINEDLMQQELSKADESVKTAKAANLVGQVNQKDADLNVRKNNYLQNQLYSNDAEFIQLKDENKAAYGMQEKLIDAILEQAPDLIGATDAEFIKKVNKIADDLGVVGFAGLTAGEYILKYTDNVKDLIKATVDYDTALENTNLAAVNDKLAGKYSDEVIKLTANSFDELVEKAKEDLDTREGGSGWGKEGISKADGANQKAQDIFNEYAIAAGLSGAELKDTKHSDSARTFVYNDVEGKEHEVSLEMMKTTVATANALEQLGASAEQAKQMLNNLAKNAGSESTAKGLQNWAVSGNFNSMNQTDFGQMKEEVGKFTSTEDYLKSVFGEDLDKVAESIGIEGGAEALIAAFEEDVKNYETAIDNIKDNMYKASQQTFKEMGKDGAFDDLGPAAIKQISDALDSAFENQGYAGLDNIKNIFDKIEPDQMETFLGTIEDMDWNTESVGDFKDKLTEAGVGLNLTDEELAALISTLKDAPSVMQDATEAYSTLHAVIDDLENGASISQKDYDSLGGDLYESFFLKMADGTYKLTTDAQHFYDIVNNKSIDNFKSNIGNIRKLQNEVGKDQASRDALENSALKSSDNHGAPSSIGKLTISKDDTQFQNQIDFLKLTGRATNQEVAGWIDAVDNGSANEAAEALQAVADKVKANKDAWETLNPVLEENMEQLASTASNLNELHNMLNQGEISTSAFTKAAMAMDAELDTQDLDPDELKDYADNLREAAKNMEGFNDEMTKDEAHIVAKGIMKMNDAIDELADNWEDWSDILSNSSNSSEEYINTMGDARQAVANLLDISKEYVDSDFITSHMEEIKQAATGDADAIDGLKKALADKVIAKIILDNSEFITNADDIKSKYNDLISSIPDIKVGVSLDGESEFVSKLNEMITETHMTVDQINALCDSMGFEANFANEPQKVTTQVPVYKIHHKPSTPNPEPGEEWSEETWTEISRYESIDGEVPAWSMTTDGTAPKVNSVTKKASGSANNYSSANAGGKSPGKSSKKGGGGDKKPDKKDKLKLEDELDRYYDINNAISLVNHTLEKNEQIQKRISSLQKHYFGNALIASLEQENQLLKERNGILEKQYANYQQLYMIQTAELEELKTKIGGIWDGDVLQNYAQVFTENVERYNAVIEKYNAMSKEMQESVGKQMVEDAKKAYDIIKEALERYQQLYYKEMYDTENKIAELRQQQLDNMLNIIENNLRKWEIKFELKLDMTKLKREWNDFMKGVEQDFRKVYKDLTIDSKYDFGNFEEYLKDVETHIQQIKDVEKEIDKMEAAKDENGVVQLNESMMFGSISEAQKKLMELQSELVQDGEKLRDLYEQIWKNYLEGLDQAADMFDDINDRLDDLSEELEYEKELIELIYGEKAYDMMDAYYKAQTQGINAQIESTKVQAQFWEEQFNESYKMNKDKHNVDLEDMSTWTEDMRKAYDNMIESQQKLNDLVIEGIKAIKDEYLNNVAKTLDAMDKQIWGMDFDKVKEDWDFIQKRADEYLDDVEGAYKIQTLANKIDQSIKDTDSTKAQQKLAKLREEEIKMLREKENLTQSDIDLAEARYQIALKEIALEEAQNNKTEMKLTRDTSGNWTYQYVADEEDVGQKQQDLLDSYNSLYEIADQAYNHAMELAMGTYEEYKEKLRVIAEDTTLSEEEKLLRLQELNELYWPEITAAMENAQLYEQETMYATAAVFAEVCEQDMEAYETLTDDQKALVDEIRDQHLEDYEAIRDALVNNYDDILSKAVDTFKQTNENSKTVAADVINKWDKTTNDSVKGAMNDAFNNVINYTKNFEKEIQNLEKISGKNIMDAGGVVDDINHIGLKMDETAAKTQALADKASSSLSVLRDFVNRVEAAWDAVIDKIRQAVEELQNYIAVMSGALSDYAGDIDLPRGSGGVSIGGSSGSGGGSGGSGGGSGGSGGGSGNNGPYTVRAHLEDGSGYFTTTVSDLETAKNIVREYRRDGGDGSVKGKDGTILFDTGGYTGEWGSEGRLAMLHQKELVLNADDTENMLSAVNSIRDIARLNDSISGAIANSIGSLVMQTIAASSGVSGTTNNSESTNNTFNITAEFPNANDVNDIREAILSLPNMMSQYVNER